MIANAAIDFVNASIERAARQTDRNRFLAREDTHCTRPDDERLETARCWSVPLEVSEFCENCMGAHALHVQFRTASRQRQGRLGRLINLVKKRKEQVTT